MTGPDRGNRAPADSPYTGAGSSSALLEVEQLTPNPVRLDKVQADIKAAVRLFSGERGSLESPGSVERFVGRDVGDENSRITLSNAVDRLREISAALQRNDTELLPSELRGWMPQISSAFYIKDTARNPGTADLQRRVVQGLKDLQLLPEDYGTGTAAAKFGKN